MNFPCKFNSPCIDPANPLANTTVERPDFDVFIGFNSDWAGLPPIGSLWTSTGCKSQCLSEVSQEAADICAANQQYLCTTTNNDGGGPDDPGWHDPNNGGRAYPEFVNDAESCDAHCPDGLVFTYTVPAGTILGTDKGRVNGAAISLACRNARRHQVCLSSLLPTVGTTGIAYSGTITASGPTVSSTSNLWTNPGGGLPPGITLAFNVGGATLTLSGTPTVAGTYSFLISVLTTAGDFMSKLFTIVVSGPTCSAAPAKVWSNASPTGQTMDTFFSGVGTIDGLALVTDQSRLFMNESSTPASWFFDTYDITASSPIAKLGLFATDGGFPACTSAIYVTGYNRLVCVCQHFNGATYDLWLYFINSDGTVLSHITGLTTETVNNPFCATDNNPSGIPFIGWISSNGSLGSMSKIFLINPVTQTVVTSASLPATHCFGLCYSCVTDSFFTTLSGNLLEYDRATLALKNTYVGVATGKDRVEYIKSTKELWLWPSASGGPMNVPIVDPTNGTVKTTLVLVDGFTGFTSYSPAYNEKLDAFCIPGPISGFSGNPYIYYFYDCQTRLLKKQVDITAQYNLFSFSQWQAQAFNPATGSVYLAGAPYNGTSNKGIIEIGTT